MNGDLQGTNGPSADLYGTFSRPSWDLQETFMGQSADLYGTFNRPLWDNQQTLMGPSANLYGTPR